MNITFYTTTTYSDIQQLNSKCIKKFFPESNHILIDGRTGWFSIWYKWLDIANTIDSDYHIYLDEDCFITSREEIIKHIEFLKVSNLDISGCADGYHEYRSGNYVALNSFFMIMNKKCIDIWKNRKEIPQFNEKWLIEYPFVKKNTSHIEYNMEFGSSGKPVNQIWKPNTEPYYDFFWVLIDNGIKFDYLEPVYEDELNTTNLLNGSIVHMWHQRERNSNQIVSSLHKISNKERYNRMIKIIENICN